MFLVIDGSGSSLYSMVSGILGHETIGFFHFPIDLAFLDVVFGVKQGFLSFIRCPDKVDG